MARTSRWLTGKTLQGNANDTNDNRAEVIPWGVISGVNVTKGMCAATLTAQYGTVTFTNILTMAHYPMTAVLYEYE